MKFRGFYEFESAKNKINVNGLRPWCGKGQIKYNNNNLWMGQHYTFWTEFLLGKFVAGTVGPNAVNSNLLYQDMPLKLKLPHYAMG